MSRSRMMRIQKRFFTFFPPPQFLLMPAVGLDLSTRSVRFVELVAQGSSLLLGRYGEAEIPEGVIARGEIADTQALAQVLSALRAKYDVRFVHASLPEEQGYVVHLTQPFMKKSEIRNGLELRLEEHVPIAPQDTIFDYSLAECGSVSKERRAREELEVSLAAISQATVSAYLEAFKAAGITPLSFELDSHASARSLVETGDCTTQLIVNIGRTRTGIYIVSRGILYFSTTISIGGNAFTEAVSRALHVEFKEAQEKKEAVGILGDKEKTLKEALVPLVAALRDEVNRYMLYWKMHHKEKEEHARAHTDHGPITKIILSGGEANVPGLLLYMQNAFKVPVELGNPWRNLFSFDEYIPDIPRNHALRYATAIGLALRGARHHAND